MNEKVNPKETAIVYFIIAKNLINSIKYSINCTVFHCIVLYCMYIGYNVYF